MLEPDKWDAVLSRISGTVYRGGIERISTREILQVLGCSERETKPIAKAMRLAGWQGPKPIRIMGTNGKSVVVSGYEREVGKVPTVVDQSQSVRGDLPSKLEAVTRLALREVGKVLKAPFDASDGVLTRNKVTAARIAINSQLRADEQQLRRKRSGDVLERLLKIIEQEKKNIEAAEKKKLSPSPSLEVPPAVQQTEDVELERSDAEATLMASGEDGSEEG
jgi:hypothetical protein